MPDTDIPWTDETDIIVIGGGGGGMAAAVAAAETDPGAEITVLQKIGELGGSTTMSMGNFSASGTTIQAECGIRDSNAAHFDDLDKIVEHYQAGSGRYFYLDFEGDLREKDNLELRRVLVEESGDTLDWLGEHGCEYAGPYADSHHSIPRLHQIKPDTTAYAEILGDAMDELGVKTHFETEAYELIQAEDGTVTGVLAKQRGRSTPMVVRARRGVVVATGDFVNSRELREEYTTDADAPPINEYNEGDGHRMAKDVGAQLLNMDVQWLLLRVGDPTYIVPEVPSLVDAGAILVNETGRRFVRETVDYDQLVKSTLRQPDGRVYLMFDGAIAQSFTEWPHHISTYGKLGKMWAFLKEYRELDIFSDASSVHALAESIGIDPDILEKTVTDYNGGIHDEVTGQNIDKFGRADSGTLTKSPYCAIGPLRTYSTITDGGVAVSQNMEILDEDDDPIPGLFAAGVIAGDHHLFGHGHHHSWIFTSGRIAGKRAVRNEP